MDQSKAMALFLNADSIARSELHGCLPVKRQLRFGLVTTVEHDFDSAISLNHNRPRTKSVGAYGYEHDRVELRVQDRAAAR